MTDSGIKPNWSDSSACCLHPFTILPLSGWWVPWSNRTGGCHLLESRSTSQDPLQVSDNQGRIGSETRTSTQEAPRQRVQDSSQWPLRPPSWKSELKSFHKHGTSQLMSEDAPSRMVEKEQGLQALEMWELSTFPPKELPQLISPLVDFVVARV